ncbi:MAG: hypothetical protein AB7O97_12400 [Planctomycetota bacterium]
MTFAKFPMLVLLGGLAACGSVPKRTFRFQAIDNEENRLHCLVVLGADWDGAADRKQLTGGPEPLQLDIVFEQPRVDVTVMQVSVDDKGELNNRPRSRADDSQYRTEVRTLTALDPTDQVFILMPRR